MKRKKEKIIVIVRGVASEKLILMTEAMYKGGIRLLEITYSADGRISDEEAAENIKKFSEHFEGRMYIGAGTVLTFEDVANAAWFLGSDLSRNTTGTELVVDDGMLAQLTLNINRELWK